MINRYKFRREKDTKTTILCRCLEQECISRCRTDLSDLMVLDERFDHYHDEADIKQIGKSCKRKATEEPCERSSKLILSEIFMTLPAQNLTSTTPW